MVELKSQRFNLEGWNFWSWFKGNWKTLKELLKVATPLGLSMLATNNPALIVPATILGKAFLDILEYAIKEH